MELAKSITALYPDLIEQGGLGNALQAVLSSIDSSLSVSGHDKSAPAHARVELGYRFSQIYIAAKTRMFSFDFWNRGVCLAHGATPEILEVARSIDTWIASPCTIGELANRFRFVQVEPTATAYERGEEAEQRWQEYRDSLGKSIYGIEAFVAAAMAEPKLRQLFPYVTFLNRVCFSRCTGWPFTCDTPQVVALSRNQYEVISSHGKSLGRGNAAEAVALVVAALPPNCGPAVPGTADDLSAG